MSEPYGDADGPGKAPPIPNVAATLVIGAIIVVALYVGREIFVPIALAVLFCFILAPLVKMLRRLGAGRVASVLAVVGGTAAGAAMLVAVVAMQFSQLAGEFPRYQATIQSKTASLRQMKIFGFTIEKATAALNKLGGQISDPGGAAGGDAPGGDAKAPIAVEVHQLPMSPLETVKIVLGPVLTTLASIGIVLVFAISILLQREDVRDRVIRLAGVRDLTRATAAIDDAAGRLSRLLLMQSLINACFGVFIGCGLWLIGIPNPILWGVFTAFMRFVPFIGAWIAAAMPLALAMAVDPGWTMLFATLGLFLVADLVAGQFIEPRLHGQSTGLSPLAIVVAATFWTALWGPLGLVLSTPLTVCLATLGRHVDNLAFFDVLFGEEPALSPAQGFYQRILAGDALEAADQADAYLKDHPLEAYCDDVAMAGLGLAVLDLRAGRLEKRRLPALGDAGREVVDIVFEDHSEPAKDVESANAASNPEIVCFCGSSPLDTLATAILIRLLHARGLPAKAASFEALTRAPDVSGAAVSPQILCVSQISPGGRGASMRFLLRRLRRSNPASTFVLCLWGCERAGAAGEESGADYVAASLKQALDACEERVKLIATRHDSVLV